MAVSHLRNTPITGKSYTTPVDATWPSAAKSPGRSWPLPEIVSADPNMASDTVKA
ncbi:hypothetical protein GA0070604_2440 [Micromonospora eburnea]|uniref:Uncharacterized protein n=1 Tax=Micromonospora eburnea TaxID=227316 RepID=A0A1C6UCU7_9ACTN|nr:hypothetical protein GA0070604_2440 [Micromonospora eburnea]